MDIESLSMSIIAKRGGNIRVIFSLLVCVARVCYLVISIIGWDSYYLADSIARGQLFRRLKKIYKAPDLGLVPVSSLDESRQDIPQWCDANGKLSTFSVKNAWEALRPRGMEVGWFRTVWFSHCIPRHAFHLWLIMRNSLKTQDKMRQWDVGMELIPPIMHDIISYFQPIAHRRTARSIIGRLILAVAYNRIFKNTRRSPEELRDMIMVTVRLKLLTFRFKNTTTVNHLLSQWKMPKNFRLYGC
ncbi:zinc finger, CCHC-type containing protein [Tanacetum coccineum]